MIKQIRIKRGFTSVNAFAVVIGIPFHRYYNIERMFIKATRDEFELIGGDIADNYEDYESEFQSKKTLMFTPRMESFAAYCGAVDPCETVRRYFATNNN